jgi:hypothetical protein
MAARIYVTAALARTFTRCVDTIKAIAVGFTTGSDSRHASNAQKRRIRIWCNTRRTIEHLAYDSTRQIQSTICIKANRRGPPATRKVTKHKYVMLKTAIFLSTVSFKRWLVRSVRCGVEHNRAHWFRVVIIKHVVCGHNPPLCVWP